MFDKDSGQVFKEWTKTRKELESQDDRDWYRTGPWSRTVELTEQARNTRKEEGPRSLLDMTTQVVIENIGAMDQRHLEIVPAALLWRLWRFFEARGSNLHAWRLLSNALLKDEEDTPLGLYKFRKHICKPTGDLPTYTQPLTSLTFDFITHIVLSGGCNFSTRDMLCLADVKNLGVLELIQATDIEGNVAPEISDRLIRGWSEKEDAFPVLRILRIWGDRSITEASLRWVSAFPALALFDIQGYRNDWKNAHALGQEHGWQANEGSSKPDDSLLGYLAHLSPLGDDAASIQSLARSADSDLLALCSDSRCTVKFDYTRQGPPLMTYLATRTPGNLPSFDPDAALREVRACHGMAFEAWAFWLYAIVGQLSNDQDLEARGVRPEYQALVGPFVLPSKPMACLFLGHSGRGGIASRPAYVSRGLFSTKQWTFTRHPDRKADVFDAAKKAKEGVEKTKPPSTTYQNGLPSKMRKTKRKAMHDLLDSFSSITGDMS